MAEEKEHTQKGATVPKTYRGRPDVIQKLEELMQNSGLPTQADFLEYVAGLVEMTQLKEGVASGYSKLIEEREYHLRREQEIIMTIIQSEAAAKLELMQKHEYTLAERNTAFLAQEQTITELAADIKHLKEERGRLEKDFGEQAKRLEQFGDLTRKSDLLLEQFEEKNKVLNSQLSEYRATMDENKALVQRVDELVRQIKKQEERILSLEQDQERDRQSHTDKISQIKERHAEELERLKDRLDVQRERELVHVRSEYQEKLEKVGAEATAKQQEATTQISKLYEQLHTLREQHQVQGRAGASEG
ncbi:hypothetical protein PV433_10665 [Paenibacillus sp. GYB004]|uniref:hypothetical protein n=1 Tax=Paenibacillus sp. GYB004 TaxID=2994393 RepID=UPI002F967D0E